MSSDRVKGYFLGAFLVGSVVLTVLIFRSYLIPLALGGVMALVAMPLYRPLRRFFRSDAVAALVTVILVTGVIVLPVAYFFSALASEIGRVIQDFGSYFDYTRISDYLGRIVPAAWQDSVPDIMGQAMEVISAIARNLSSNLLRFFSNVVSASLGFLVMLFSMYYLMKDGHNIKREMLALSPLDDDRDERIFRNVVVTVRAVIVGFLFIGLLKGLLAGFAYWAAGVTAPLFWGTMTGLAFFIPMVGSGLVMIPIAAYLAITGHWVAAIGLGLFMVLVVGMVDNFIQPRFIGSRAKIHPLLVLLSLLGGIEFLGFAGIILGPLVLAMTLALIEIYKSDYGSKGPGPVPEG
ncbi:AI-2E family transporter [Candidatus Uhrbacteria bacterium]|nr:AI-2E family transporter [Candidatus Uhrbacteria bacterium]